VEAPRYDAVAGVRIERLAALSDGIFAVAMTLLVLELRVPVSGVDAHSERALLDALRDLVPQFLTYFMSFLTLGIFWLGQHAQLDHFARGNRRLAWIHVAFLCAVALMPFSTSLLADFVHLRLAFALYWLNLFLLGACLFASIRYAARTGLVADDSGGLQRMHERRIVGFQAAYACCLAVALVEPYAGIALVIAFQVYSVVSSRVSPFARR
jgi:uncharacterized membrane protein